MLTKLLLITLITVLSGCVSLPVDPTKMSAEQLKEWAKDKNANIVCGIVNSPYGRGIATYVVLDKTVIFNGTVTVDGECKVSITNDSSKPTGK